METEWLDWLHNRCGKDNLIEYPTSTIYPSIDNPFHYDYELAQDEPNETTNRTNP